MKTKEFKIDSAKSRIDWIGKKVTGAHNGTIGIQKGVFVLTEGQPSHGEVVIDMATISILDITDAATNTQFAGHLESDDFFGIEKHPTATFVIQEATPLVDGPYLLEGVLTIKGIAHTTGFTATISTTGDSISITGKLMVDRTKYGIKFRSGNFFKDLGDTLIYNDFELNVDIIANSKD